MELKFTKQFLLVAFAVGSAHAGCGGDFPESKTFSLGEACCDNAASPTKCLIADGNPACGDLDAFGVVNDDAFKVDCDAKEGTYELDYVDDQYRCGVEVVGATLEAAVDVKRPGTGLVTQTLTSADGVTAIILKGGSGSTIYFGDAILGTMETPVNSKNGKNYGLSHLEWCYNPAKVAQIEEEVVAPAVVQEEEAEVAAVEEAAQEAPASSNDCGGATPVAMSGWGYDVVCCDSATNPTMCGIPNANPKCSHLNPHLDAIITDDSFKLDCNPKDRSYSFQAGSQNGCPTVIEGTVDNSLTVSVTNIEDGVITQTLTADDGIGAVIMKGGNGCTIYMGEAMKGQLATPGRANGSRPATSHVEFCIGSTPPVEELSTAATDAATPAVGEEAPAEGEATDSTGGSNGSNGSNGKGGIAELTCDANPPLEILGLHGPGNGGDYRCCGGKHGDNGEYVASCDTSSCVENFDAKNLNCHNYGSPQNPVGGNPLASGGSALCPYMASDQAICDVEAFNIANGVSCRNSDNKGAKVHCLGYVKCKTQGVTIPKNDHSDGTAPYADGADTSDGANNCASTEFPEGTICFYNGYSENFKVCGGSGLEDPPVIAVEPEVTEAPTEPATDPAPEVRISAPTEPSDEPTEAVAKKAGGAYGDPHVRTWSGEHYEYHGACDLVLVNAPGFNNGEGLSVHIRNKPVKRWSYIDTSVLLIGGETLEVKGGQGTNEYWINGVKGDPKIEDGTLSATIAGRPIKFTWLTKGRRRFVVDLGDGEEVVFKTFKYFVRANVRAKKEENFGTAGGLMGSYPSGKMMSRDGKKEFTDTDEFGQEWQVLPSEPMLFHDLDGPSAPQKCVMPVASTSRRLAESAITLEDAQIACAHVAEEDRDECVFDVLATEDKDMAGAY